MAIARRSDTGSLIADGVSGAQSIAFVTTMPSAGDLIVAGGGIDGNGTNITPVIADNQGNGNYTIDVQQSTRAADTSQEAVIGSKANVASSGTFNVTFNSGTSGFYLGGCGGIAFSGAATSSALDAPAVTSARTENADQSSQSTGTTATTAQADEVAVIALSVGNSGNLNTLTATGFTVVGNSPNGTLHAVGGIAFKVLVATGTQSGTWTYGVSSGSVADDHAAAIATYKGAGGTVADNPRNYRDEAVDDSDDAAALDEQWGIPRANRDLIAGDYSASMVETTTGAGASTATGDFNSAGSAVVTGSGASLVAAAFNTSGVANVTGAGAATAQAAFTATDTAAVTGDAKSTVAASFSAAGIETTVGDAKSTAAAAFSTQGVLSLIGDNASGGSVVSADGSITASLTLTGFGASTVAAAFTSTGAATLVGTAAATVAAAGNIVISGVLVGRPASARRNQGAKPKKQEDDFLMDLAMGLVPFMHELRG